MRHGNQMLALLSRAPARMRVNFILISLFLAATMLFGGASRADVLSLPIARLAAVVVIAIAMLQLDAEGWRSVRTPALFLCAIAVVIAVQLVPLPPSLWQSLPGHALYVEPLRAAGMDGSWRPISLTPDLTLNALLAVLPPLAMVLALGTIDRAFHRMFLFLLLAAVALNGLVGLVQISSGSPYFYTITNEGTAVGFFSNRNHLGLLVALAFPLLACWAAQPAADHAVRRQRTWIVLCAGAAIFPLLLATGSRAALILGAIGLLLGLGIRMSGRRRHGEEPAPEDRRTKLLRLAPFLIGILAIGAVLYASRDVALHRLIQGEEVEQRSTFLPVYATMAKDHFPTGAGFGSFATIFQAYEPQESMTVEYMNQAHNDWVQLVIEGGLPAALLAFAFILWFARRSWAVWRRMPRSPAEIMARTGSAGVLLILLASAVDYPLRTPIMAVVMALFCCWMLPARSTPET